MKFDLLLGLFNSLTVIRLFCERRWFVDFKGQGLALFFSFGEWFLWLLILRYLQYRELPFWRFPCSAFILLSRSQAGSFGRYIHLVNWDSDIRLSVLDNILLPIPSHSCLRHLLLIVLRDVGSGDLPEVVQAFLDAGDVGSSRLQ